MGASRRLGYPGPVEERPSPPSSFDPGGSSVPGGPSEWKDLRARVLGGVAWKGISLAAGILSRVVVTLILARLLTPRDFGLAAMVLVFSALPLLLSDVALGAALIQRREIGEAERSTVFWASVAIGLVLTPVGVALSGPIADFYGESEVQPLFAALSLCFLLAALGSTHAALLARDLDFRKLEIRLIAANVVGAGLGITAAALGAGAWAIILQTIAVTSVSSALLWWFSTWRPSFIFSPASLRDVVGLSGNVLGVRLLFFAERNTDNLLVGRFLGAPALGAYSVAYNLMLVPVERIAGPIRQVLFPAFSRIQDDARRLTSAWLRVSRLVAAVCAPAMVGMMILAPDFVPIVLGERWDRAIPVIQILAWVGLLQAVESLNGSLLVARDRSATLLRFSVGALGISLIGFGVGLNWGIVGVAAGYAIAATISWIALAWLTSRAIGSSLTDLWRSVAGVLQASLVLAAGVLLGRLALVAGGVPVGPRLAILVVLGAVLYTLCCLWRAPELVAEIRELRAVRRGTDPASGAAPGGS
jgi:O-antigen/teichoic acid export membrane protein